MSEQEKEKTFSENAKDFFSAWKNDYGKKNQKILDRKKEREAEAEQMNKEMEALWAEIKKDLKGKSAELYNQLSQKMSKFTISFIEGTTSVAEKMDLEKRLDELNAYLEQSGSKASDKINLMTSSIQKRLKNFDNELYSEKE